MRICFENVSTDGGLKELSLEIPVDGCTVIDDQAETQSPHILRVLAGLEAITGGKVCIDGTPSREFFSSRSLHQVFGYVFDEGIMLSNLSLRENIMLPLRRFGKDKPKDRIEVSLEKWMQRFGLDIDLGLRPAVVNAARLKYISYIRALLLEPDILVIDDPYYLLNKKERAVMLGVLNGLKRDTALLIASTDDDFTVVFADTTLHLGEKSTSMPSEPAAKA